MNNREIIFASKNISSILQHANDTQCVLFFDLDNTLLKLDEDKNKHVGGDAWFYMFLALAKNIYSNNIAFALELVLAINDDLQQFIHLKPTEKNTLKVLHLLQEKYDLPVIILTARGQRLIPSTQQQLKKAKFNFNHAWSQSLGHESVELHLDYDLYIYHDLPDNLENLKYKYTYVYSKNDEKLYYFNRYGEHSEIEIICKKDFKEKFFEILDDENPSTITKDQIYSIISENSMHLPEKRIIVYQDECIYCDGQDKGKAISAFYKWAGLNPTKTIMSDDKEKNINDVRKAISDKHQYVGMIYNRIDEKKFNQESSHDELAIIYPNLLEPTQKSIQQVIPNFQERVLQINTLSFFATTETRVIITENNQVAHFTTNTNVVRMR